MITVTAVSLQVHVYLLYQEEIRELKEQVMMYESVSQFGIFSATSSGFSKTAPGFDDSYAQLGIHKSENKIQPPQWPTPDSNRLIFTTEL